MDIDSEIIRQLEYYFGDMNLIRDNYLREQVLLHDDGWVPLEVLIRFNRLAKLSTDSEVITAALNKSTSGLLEVSEDRKKVRRCPGLPMPEMNEERRKELTARTVYAKGFPRDAEMDILLKFFRLQGDVENVIMRMYIDRQSKKKMFKGSVLATFKTNEQAAKFVGTKNLTYDKAGLLLLWQEDHLKMQQKRHLEKREKKEKKRKDMEALLAAKREKEIKLPTGTVLHFSEGHDTMRWEDIKQALETLGAKISYIDFQIGDTSGWVRLSKENAAKEVAAKMTGGKMKIANSDVVFKTLEGDEENAYLVKTVEEMVKRRKGPRTTRTRRMQKLHRGSFNNRNRLGKKRKQDEHDNSPPSKVKANNEPITAGVDEFLSEDRD